MFVLIYWSIWLHVEWIEVILEAFNTCYGIWWHEFGVHVEWKITIIIIALVATVTASSRFIITGLQQRAVPVVLLWQDRRCYPTFAIRIIIDKTGCLSTNTKESLACEVDTFVNDNPYCKCGIAPFGYPTSCSVMNTVQRLINCIIQSILL